MTIVTLNAPIKAPNPPARPQRRRAMRASATVILDAPVDTVWRELQKPALLLHVTRGLMRFAPEDPEGFPEIWLPREYSARLYACGVIPVGLQIIGIEHPAPDGGQLFMRDNGRGEICSRWDHLMVLAPTADGRTRYQDLITVDAGRATPLMISLAWLYYILRQRRLKRAAARGFVY